MAERTKATVLKTVSCCYTVSEKQVDGIDQPVQANGAEWPFFPF